MDELYFDDGKWYSYETKPDRKMLPICEKRKSFAESFVIGFIVTGKIHAAYNVMPERKTYKK